MKRKIMWLLCAGLFVFFMGAASLSQEAWGASSPGAREAERIERAELFKRIENLDKLPQKAREAERAELVKKVTNFRRSLSSEEIEAERAEILKKNGER